MNRCSWCGSDELYVRYHDEEWGKPVYEDIKQFEFLVLESAQAGLSWITILRKRESFRKAYEGFDPAVVAGFGEEKIKELQAFIARFSANASKSKQATSRKKLLDKITLDDIRPSSRRYPYVGFTPEREIGNDLLRVEGLTKTIDGVKVLDNINFVMNKDDKIALVGTNEIAKTTLFKILMGEMEADSGTFKWGITTSQAYFPKDNSEYFNDLELNLVDWMRQYSEEKAESYLRGFLGRMLFSGDEALKEAKVLSGGERVRCMLSRMMLSSANVLILDQPTNHLDLESITAVNNGLVDYKSNVLFASHDHQFIQTIANRIIEITPDGLVDKQMTYDEYLESIN
jgi:ATPase subunit of ABC transporter with duplicated ATPase domains